MTRLPTQGRNHRPLQRVSPNSALGLPTISFGTISRGRVARPRAIALCRKQAYENAITSAFEGSDYGQIIKSYRREPPINAARRSSPGWVVAVNKRAVGGRPRDDLISTSYVERSNLNVRMDCRRFTRLTNGYSKKLENHHAAIGLFIACYNLCGVQRTLKMTPAGVADHPWSIAGLMDAAEAADHEERPFPPIRHAGAHSFV